MCHLEHHNGAQMLLSPRYERQKVDLGVAKPGQCHQNALPGGLGREVMPGRIPSTLSHPWASLDAALNPILVEAN